MIFGIHESLRTMENPIANHLWQSSVFALLAACSTLLLNNNAARLRYAVWLAASIKFLLPFALLIWLGSFFHPHVATASPQRFVFIAEITGQPFRHTAPAQSSFLADLLPFLVAAVWMTGTLAVLLLWARRWRQIRRVKQTSKQLNCGAEVEMMVSLGHELGATPLPVLICEGRLGPAVFGVFRPVLLWPAHLSREIEAPERRSLLAHELWHVRRRDNLTAALQMLIEALFWFHPLVWWMGARQVEERERACDEGVLALGGEPAVYAEGILKVCRFCIEAPLPCAVGVSGSNLKKRIVHIMQTQNITALSRAKKAWLGTLAATAIAAPIVFGIFTAPSVEAQSDAFQASSGPLRITEFKRTTSDSGLMLFEHSSAETSIQNTTIRNLIEIAYSLKDFQLTGGPSWIDTDRFDIAFTGGPSSGPVKNMASPAALKEILSQELHLVLRQQTKPGSVFALVVASGGAKFSTVTPANAPGTDEPLLSIRVMKKDGQGQVAITGGPGGLADVLSPQLGRPVVDKTGLNGIYSIDFHWATNAASADSISADLQQQLGLALVPQEGPVETSVIESVSPPAGS